jgi:Putative zinc-finger
MPNEPNHLSDQEILLAFDDELDPSRRIQVHAHLDSCATCRARLAEIKFTLAEFSLLRQSEGDEKLPPADHARAVLQARLAESIASSRRGLLPAMGSLMFARTRWAVAGAALLFATLGIWAIRHQEAGSPEADPALAGAELGPIPDKNLTPGATVPVTAAEICRLGDTGETRPIQASLRQRVLQEYRTPESHAAEYEVDYLITPGLGGADDIRNLWPEPYTSTTWNAHVKDALEDRLHDMVCSGQLDLATAQHDIATDWISAYKKYFHTRNPLSSPSNSSSHNL